MEFRADKHFEYGETDLWNFECCTMYVYYVNSQECCIYHGINLWSWWPLLIAVFFTSSHLAFVHIEFCFDFMKYKIEIIKKSLIKSNGSVSKILLLNTPNNQCCAMQCDATEGIERKEKESKKAYYNNKMHIEQPEPLKLNWKWNWKEIIIYRKRKSVCAVHVMQAFNGDAYDTNSCSINNKVDSIPFLDFHRYWFFESRSREEICHFILKNINFLSIFSNYRCNFPIFRLNQDWN